jgi:D-alanyl-D-alanine carboxypeptidase
MQGRGGCKGDSRLVVASLGLALSILVGAAPAEARGRHHLRAQHAHAGRHHGGARSSSLAGLSSPAFAALVIDANTGHTLYAVDENGLRHPASITKVMTLYLLFEKLDKGDLSLSTPITVSRHAASQSPTKLGLRPGSTITVENAIKAIVTRSANDMAVAVAEAVGGDEDTFAGMMTRKAHALGMSRTTYVNASGLPDNRQITTARDLTILGRAIQDRFPQYYHFFSIPSFTYAGHVIGNHNHLMERVEGMDGIKTGYTNASGFNLLSNVRRDGHHIVAVVMGGKSAAGRDRIMEGLIAEHLEEAAPTRTVAAIEDRSTEPAARTVEVAEADSNADSDADSAAHDESPGPNLIAPTMAVPPPPRATGRSWTGSATKVSERPRPAFVAATRAADVAPGPTRAVTGDRDHLAQDGSTSGRASGSSTAVALATATPSALRWSKGPQSASRSPGVPALDRAVATPAKVATSAKQAADDHDETGSTRKRLADSKLTRGKAEEPDVSPTARGSWVIQIGATDSASAATTLLSRARTQSRTALSAARPMTEKVQRGAATLYRARFAGLGPEQAEAACKSLKRSGFACFATHD